jgi:hypothetical protein
MQSARLSCAGRSPRRRRGVTTIESILVLFMLIFATLGALQFGLALVVKQAITHAATVAAREAAKGADLDELEEVVEKVLEGHQIVIGPDATLVLEPGILPPVTRGDYDCTQPVQPVIDSDEVRVTLCVSLTAPPFLNILRNYGLDFTGCSFMASSVATYE